MDFISIEEQSKRLRKVDDLVQQAEKTLQKIRDNHERLKKQQQLQEKSSPRTRDYYGSTNNLLSSPSSSEQKVPEKIDRAPQEKIKRTEIVESLYLKNLRSSSSSSVEIGLKTLSEEDLSDEQKIIGLNVAENTPSPKKQLKDVEVATVGTPLRDEAISVTNRDLVRTRSAGTSSLRDDDEGKFYKAGIFSLCNGVAFWALSNLL